MFMDAYLAERDVFPISGRHIHIDDKEAKFTPSSIRTNLEQGG